MALTRYLPSRLLTLLRQGGEEAGDGQDPSAGVKAAQLSEQKLQGEEFSHRVLTADG